MYNSIFAQTHPNVGMQLIAMAPAATLTGNASGLALEDAVGNPLSVRDVNIQQGGVTVAIGSYTYGLRTQYVSGADDNGLYIDYQLTQLDLQPGETLTLTEAPGATGIDIDMAAQLTGAGNLNVAADTRIRLSNANNTFTGTTDISSGTLEAAATDVISSSDGVNVHGGATFDLHGYNQSVNNLVGSGTVTNASTNEALITLHNPDSPSLFSGSITGPELGVHLASGTQILSGPNSYGGPTTISDGTLLAAATNTLSPNSAVTVTGFGTLDLGGYSQTVAALNNGSLVTMGAETTPGAVLTVNGNYFGDNGVMVFNTALGNENSPTDKLWVRGNTGGNTFVLVNNVGGLGAQTNGNGIRLVQVDGASNGTFLLDGRVSAGAWDYNLFHNGVGADAGDGDWYLRSEASGGGEEPRAEVEAAMAVRSLISHYGLATLGTYHDRTGGEICLGTVYLDGRCETTGWLRLIGEFGTFDNEGTFADRGASYTFSLGAMQAGIDLYRSARGTLGLFGGMGTVQGDVTGIPASDIGRTRGEVSFNSYSLGGYWTHHGVSGWYTDAVVQNDWNDRVLSSVSGGSSMSTRGFNIIGSLEAGAPLVFSCGCYSFEPQAQVVYERLHLRDSGDEFGRFLFPDNNAFYGRIGGRFSSLQTAEDGKEFSTWIRANIWHAFTDSPETTVTTLDGEFPATFPGGMTLGRTWGQFGVGFSGEASTNVGMFGTIDYNANFGDGSGFSVGGRLGMRVNW
jgi:fibronectin-binding autotransporter adhesin